MIRKLFFIIFLLPTLSYGQINSEQSLAIKNSSITKTLYSDAVLSFNTSLDLLKSPYSFDKEDMIMTGVVLGMTAASFSLDNKLRSETFNSHNPTMDKFTDFGEKFGTPIYGSILSGLLYTTGLFTSNTHLKATGQMLAEGILTNGIYTQLLKITFGRARPFTGEPNTEIDPFEFEFESAENSFPSGHTSTAFTIATILSEQIDNIYVSIGLYSLASLTAYQRIYADVHWFSDTIFGAALGTFIGLKIVKLHNGNLTKSENYKLSLYPQFSSKNYGLGLSIQF